MARHLFEEEVIGQVVEHHGVAGVDRVGSRQQLHSIFDGVGLLVVELQNGEANQSSNTLWVELQGSTESQTGLLQFAEFHKAVAHPEPHLSCIEDAGLGMLTINGSSNYFQLKIYLTKLNQSQLNFNRF